MSGIKNLIKNTVLEIREFFWNYPYFFSDHNILMQKSSIWKWFMLARPISLIIVFGVIFLLLLLAQQSFAFDLNKNHSTILEGVIKSPEFSGKVLVNPLLNNQEQINKSLNKIIYETLFVIKPNGDILPNLAEKYEFLEEGKVLSIKLREDVYWHNGENFTSEDVAETLRRLKNLPSTTNSASGILDTAEIEIIDKYKINIRKSVVLASIIESINVGIMPKKELVKYNYNRLEIYPINSEPIGTGPFKFKAASADRVVLDANNSYWKGKPKVKEYIFNLYDTEKEAVIALKSGQIHLFNNLSYKYNSDLASNNNLSIVKSDPYYRKYWAVYFNLANSDVAYSDINFRQAIAMAINKDKLIDNINNLAIAAHNTIPPISWVANNSVDTFDPGGANKLLDKTGYIKGEIDTFRFKDGKPLELEISFANTPDKVIVTQSIKEDLEDVGIQVKLDPQDINTFVDSTIPSRNFNSMVYGSETLNDPDRIGFWHEDAIPYPGLNYSSYVSNVKVKDPITGERTSRVNDALTKALSTHDRELRKNQYDSLIKIMRNEVPAVFLYYPIEQVVNNKRLEGINLKDISLPEEMYLSMYLWSLN